MSEFKAITTQEEFDAAITARLTRERETVAKKYEGYTSPEDLQKIKADYEKQIGELTKAAETAKTTHAAELAERDRTIAKYETDSVKTRIAHEIGLPYELAARLTGETEDDIRQDAETIKGLMSTTPGGVETLPLKTSDTKTDSIAAAWNTVLSDIKSE